MNKNYQSGRRLEYDSMKRWKERGYQVIRASGSHGLFDIVAYNSGRPTEFIQCKVVSSETTAKRLISSFRATPPLYPSTYFHQVLEVKVKGSTDIISTTM